MRYRQFAPRILAGGSPPPPPFSSFLLRCGGRTFLERQLESSRSSLKGPWSEFFKRKRRSPIDRHFEIVHLQKSSFAPLSLTNHRESR